MTSNIINHPAFKNCGGELLLDMVGGSRLYGLANENSDTDWRGLFAYTNVKYITGFENIESIVQHSDEIDSTHYEVAHFLKLMRKSNTQVMELAFAPESAIYVNSDIFERIRANRYSLIDSHILKNSLRGYVFSEIKLATGERSGRLGGKRKEAVEKYGFSFKNFCQLLRLCEVGKLFFTTGEYMVKVKDSNPAKHDLLMEIKTQPQNFTKDQLSKMVDDAFNDMNAVIENSIISFKFDVELAADIVREARYISLDSRRELY
jgi:hypothetical protein